MFGAGAVAALAFAVTGCGDPDLNTDLDPDGPPEVLIVTVDSESDGTLISALDEVVPDTPVFCADSGKVNQLICGDDDRPVTDAVPLNWGIRVVFSELLDPDVEELIDLDDDGVMDIGSIAGTSPVTLTCGGTAVAYDGFYDPSGNAYSYPPGPSLVVIATDFVATGTSDCSITVDGSNVTDKDGNAPTATGPYTFGIATMKLVGNDPQDMAEGLDPTTTVPSLAFNALVDAATVDEVTVNDGNTDIAVTAQLNADDPTVVELVPDSGALASNTTYTVTVPATADIADIEGGALEIGEAFTFTFTTGVPDPGM